MERVLAAIQARKLDRLAAAYALGGWLLVQGASIVLPAFGSPGWTLKALILFTLLGFPVTLGLGWLGARHLPSVPLERPRHAPIHLAALATVAVIFLLVIGEAALRLARHDGETETPAKRAAAALSGSPAPTSIAVLPFANMSGDPRQDYFSDGMAEELLSDLANIPQLRVVARTSSFAFKGKNDTIQTIARLLSVRSIVEGSVRATGQHLRVHAELINAVSGYGLWSASFDRDMTDALAVQNEIARAITGALTHKLLPEGPRTGRPVSIDPKAYQDYLQAQYRLAPRTRDGAEQAVALFEQVVARQANFAEAYAGLGRAYILLAKFHPERADAIPSAEKAIGRALALDPRNLDALGLHVDLAMRRLDWTGAREAARRLIALNPHSQSVLHELFRYYQILGFPEAALHAAQEAAQLNRLSIVDRMNVAAAFAHLARWDESARAGQEALKLYPNQPVALSRLCLAYAHSRRSAKAREIEHRLQALHEQVAAQVCAFHVAVGEGNQAQAVSVLNGLAAKYPQGDLAALDIGDNYAIAGDFISAAKWLNLSYRSRDFTLFTMPYDRAIAPAFFQTAGWQDIKKRPLWKPWQAAHDAEARDLAAR